jgi:hypothetical protein
MFHKKAIPTLLKVTKIPHVSFGEIFIGAFSATTDAPTYLNIFANKR